MSFLLWTIVQCILWTREWAFFQTRPRRAVGSAPWAMQLPEVSSSSAHAGFFPSPAGILSVRLMEQQCGSQDFQDFRKAVLRVQELNCFPSDPTHPFHSLFTALKHRQTPHPQPPQGIQKAVTTLMEKRMTWRSQFSPISNWHKHVHGHHLPILPRAARTKKTLSDTEGHWGLFTACHFKDRKINRSSICTYKG